MKSHRFSVLRIAAIAFVVASVIGLPIGAAQYQKKAPPAPRPRPQPAQAKSRPATRPTGTKLYENKEHQFSIRAPAGWTDAGGGGLLSLTVVATPEISPAPRFYVRSEKPDSPVADVDAAVEWLKADYAKKNKDAKFRDVQSTKLAGEDARILTVDNAKSPGSVERATVALHNGEVIVCVLEADDAKSYQRSQSMSDSVVRTLKWLDKKPAPSAATMPHDVPTASN
jgi:hypothetical protein